MNKKLKKKQIYVMFNSKCLCCPKIGITQDPCRLIAKGLGDLAFTCSRCQREAMDVVRVKKYMYKSVQ